MEEETVLYKGRFYKETDKPMPADVKTAFLKIANNRKAPPVQPLLESFEKMLDKETAKKKKDK